MKFRSEVRILVTGGTLDKVHHPTTESLGFRLDGQSHIEEMLDIGKCTFPGIDVLMLKDSLEFEETDRQLIREKILAVPERHIVVTHGTGTMEVTARYLDDFEIDKTVVLTGSMRPFSLSNSDANFNLGGAIVAAQILPSGIYGVMNGRTFQARDLRKNIKLGRFDS